MAENHEVIEVQVVTEDKAVCSGTESAGKAPTSSVLCKLCLDEILVGKKFTLESCGCFFCTDCMKTYITVLIKDGVALSITCPDSECVIQGELQIHEIRTLVDEDETFEKYLRLKYEQEVAVDPNRTFCPNPNCSNVCHVYTSETMSYKKMKKRRKEANSNRQIPEQVECPVCHLEFCHICKNEWSEGHKCANPVILSGEGDSLNLQSGPSKNDHTDALIKRCPVCSILIEKDRGCAQMICKNCSHVFCWYCLKLLDNDFMLRHYDKGPCKNFLGHSRSQVLRHRLGVVGLFAAFSLLLIVALPILILAAPVFLCCKWKECCERAWRRAQMENNNALFDELEREMQKYARGNRNSLEVVSEIQNRNSADLSPLPNNRQDPPDPQPHESSLPVIVGTSDTPTTSQATREEGATEEQTS